MSRRTIGLDNRLYSYLTGISLREPDLLAKLREETAAHPHARMQIAPEQGQFMALLVKLTGAKRALEVGVFTGYSALSVALALPEDGELTALEIDPEPVETARRYWQEAGVSEKIDLRLGNAVDSLDTLLAEGREGTWDFAFIDADKENYETYFERCLALLRPGGLICVDNVLWSGRPADPDNNEPATRAIRAFNKNRLGDERVDISVLPIADGLTLARKR